MFRDYFIQVLGTMLIIIYLLFVNIVSFILFAYDKKMAVKKKFRIPEKTLLLWAFVGGSIGSIFGMLMFRHKIRKRKFSITIPVLVAIEIIFAAFCLYQNLAIEVTHYDHTCEKTPESLEGYTIVQISDLHNEFYGIGQHALIGRIKKLSPDVIFVTGDVIDSAFTNYDLAYTFFEKACKIAPVYYVTGNHEERLPEEKLASFISDIEKLGVICMNDKCIQKDGYILMGLSDSSAPVEDPARSVTNDSMPVICLSHNPSYVRSYLSTGADIVFTGHMHGGQIIVPGKGGLLSPEIEFFPEYYAGEHIFEKDGHSMTMYISRGLGNSILPLRINNRPEIVTVTLHHG